MGPIKHRHVQLHLGAFLHVHRRWVEFVFLRRHVDDLHVLVRCLLLGRVLVTRK